MQRVTAGERDAQREVVIRLAPRARQVSLAVLRNHADADDAAQQSLVEVLKSARTFQGTSSLERWADRIVARTAIRFAKSSRLHATLSAEDAPHAMNTPSEGAALDVSKYLAVLSEAQRTTLVMRHVMDCSIEEIAEATGVPANTVKDRLVRALGRIREIVRRAEETPT